MTDTYPKRVFFITGASGSGKTVLVSRLQGKFSLEKKWIFLHFDAVGVPTEKEMIKEYGSPENWQKEMAHLWIDKILKDYTDEDTVVIEGSVNLKFIRDAFAKHDFKDYQIVLIDYDEKSMPERLLTKRKQPELLNKDMLGWLKFLRGQAQELGSAIIDSSSLTEKEMVKEFMKIIG